MEDARGSRYPRRYLIRGREGGEKEGEIFALSAALGDEREQAASRRQGGRAGSCLDCVLADVRRDCPGRELSSSWNVREVQLVV